MIELTAGHFDDLCRNGDVVAQMTTIEERRREAVRKFWTRLLVGIALAVASGWSLIASGWPFAGMVCIMVFFIGGLVGAILPLSHISDGIKHPVLERLAEAAGMEFVADGFSPPVYPDARAALFGGWLSSESFTDLFHGKDSEDRRFAFYEAALSKKQGKNSTTIFRGQVYALQRRGRITGQIVIVPDKGVFNVFKPQRGLQRVKFDGDMEFERRFEVYATHGHEALGLVGSDLRRLLLELRGQGRVLAYVGPEDALVAVWGKNRFEPGSMFKALHGRERVKLMFDDVCAAFGVLKRLRRSLG